MEGKAPDGERFMAVNLDRESVKLVVTNAQNQTDTSKY